MKKAEKFMNGYILILFVAHCISIWCYRYLLTEDLIKTFLSGSAYYELVCILIYVWGLFHFKRHGHIDSFW